MIACPLSTSGLAARSAAPASRNTGSSAQQRTSAPGTATAATGDRAPGTPPVPAVTPIMISPAIENEKSITRVIP